MLKNRNRRALLIQLSSVALWGWLSCPGDAQELPAPDAPARKADKAGSAVSDAWYGLQLTVNQPWTRAPLSGFTVPGIVRCAWVAEPRASAVIFIQETGTAVDPRVILDASVKAQRDTLGAKVPVQDLRTVAGMRAMWMVVQGSGSGTAIDGRGDVPTTQHWVAIPRTEDVVVVLLTTPTAEYAAVAPEFEKLVGSLKLQGSQTAEQKGAR